MKNKLSLLATTVFRWPGLFFLLVVFQVGVILAQSQRASPDLESMISSTINNTYNYNFKDAVETTDRIISTYPLLPEGYLYKCGVYWKMLEEGCVESTDSAKGEIKLLVDEACELSADEVDKNPNDVRGLFCYAGALVYRARYEAGHHDWFAVMSDGIKTKKMLEKAIGVDTNFYDAYSGVGAFNYYAARIPWYLKPIALVVGVGGNEDEGISQLKKAAQLGKYAKVEAAVFLASVVYVNKEDYSSALKIMLNLHKEFPDNIDFLRNLCRDYYEMHNYDEAIRFADIALSKDNLIGSCHRNSIGYVRFYRGKSYESLNMKEKAIADYEMVVKLNGDDYSSKEAKAALENLRNQ